ncbi:MAG: TraR/DksA C4-type zinc finger protein [Motiliproteus sp.]|nr:TraR/DksA C4-type zinc finger protein [Motiliproteus sp.]MCW9054255.1 TraR/DksA C4-type zinc finger protein [Motiliproteus sp.]
MSLSNADVQQCQGLLEQKFQQLREDLAQAEQSCQPVSLDQSKVGRVSRVDAIQQQQLAKAGLQALKNELRLVERAQLRVEQGEYGECLECGEDIAVKRLQARPETPYCLECQASLED